MVLSRLSLLAFALAAAPAMAQVQVVSATPAAGATVAAPARISLRMSGPLDARLSGATLTMTGMPGMAGHDPMAMATRSSVGPDGATLILLPARKLPAGSYRVDWHTASGAAGRVTGTHVFTVK